MAEPTVESVSRWWATYLATPHAQRGAPLPQLSDQARQQYDARIRAGMTDTDAARAVSELVKTGAL